MPYVLPFPRMLHALPYAWPHNTSKCIYNMDYIVWVPCMTPFAALSYVCTTCALQEMYKGTKIGRKWEILHQVRRHL